MTNIGVYFINYDGKIILDSMPYKKGRYLNGLYDSNVDHWELFDSLSSKFDTDDYINVPRGRVIFDGISNKSIIYIDKCYCKNRKILHKIIELFKVKKYIVKTDAHYQCPNCLEDIWED